MAISCGVGSSSGYSAHAAGVEAATHALAELGGVADAALVFATAHHAQQTLMDGVRSVLGDAKIVGCSGEGIITGLLTSEGEHGVAVMALSSDSIHFNTFVVEGFADDSAGAGARLAQQVSQAPLEGSGVLVVLVDGIKGNSTEFLAALDEGLPDNIIVVGGNAGDDMMFAQTYQYVGDHVTSEAAVALLIHGPLSADVVASHGCTPIGLKRRITKSDGGWVHEIDGKPAWDVFKEYLSGDPQDLNAEGIVHLCVGQQLTEGDADEYDTYIIRTPMDLNKETGALFFPGGGIFEGDEIRLTRRDPHRIPETARACAERARRGDTPSLVLQFDCAGRGRILFGSCAADKIVQPLREVLGEHVPWLGFHTFGEIAPIRGKSYYHNYTVALCVIYA
jgi:hypothetical protein